MLLKENDINNNSDFFSNFFNSSSDILFFLNKDGAFNKINIPFESRLGYKKKEIIGISFLELFDEAEIKQQAEDFIIKATASLEGQVFKAKTLCSNGKHTHIIFTGSFNPESGQIYVMAREINKKENLVNKELLLDNPGSALNEQIKRLEILAIIGQEAQANIPLQKIMDRTVKYIAKILHIDLCQICELDPEHNTFKIKSSFGIGKEYTQEEYAATSEYEFGYTLTSNKAVIIPDIDQETRFHFSGYIQEMKLNSGIIVIIPANNNSYGTLSIFSKKQQDFTHDYYVFLETVANTIAALVEKKRVEESVNISEKSYRDLFNFSSELIYILDLQTNYVDVNNSVLELYGYTKEEIIGKSFLFLSDSTRSDFVALEKHMKNVLSGEMEKMEWWGKKKNGEIFLKELVIRKGIYFGQEVFIATARDITERKHFEESVKASEAKYLMLLENLNDGIVYTDEEDIIQYANSSFCKMVDSNPEDLKGKHAQDVLHINEDHEYVKENSENIAEGVKQYEIEITTKSGKKKWLLINGTPIYNDFSKVVGTLLTHMDITERKIAEMELEVRNKDLNTFIYKVSHDLKGPLTSIIGLINIAKDESKDEVARTYFNLIDKCTVKLDTILMDLLELTRIQIGKYEEREINFNDLLREIFDHIRDNENTQNFEFKTDIEDGVTFCTDLNIIHAILKNLIFNSFSYRQRNSQNSFVLVKIFTNGDNLNIIVEDNGMGIDFEQQEKVFEMFFRGSQYSTGSGLGLFIVSTAVKKIKGSVTLKSEKSVGTSVYISLPFKLHCL